MSVATNRDRRGSLALAIVATELAAMFVGAIMPTPLYPLYRQAFGFSGITLTLIYAVYVLGNLVALLFFGRLSDQIGRRNTSLPAIGCGLASTAVFAAAASTPWLFAARALSGFSTGLAAGAATAWIAELYGGGTQGSGRPHCIRGKFLRLRRRTAAGRPARPIRARTVAAVLSRLSRSALRHRRRHRLRARDGDEAEASWPRSRSSRGSASRSPFGCNSSRPP